MAKTKNTPKISRKSAAAPIPERAMVHYTDDARDHRDLIIGSAIRAAINIIANDDNEAADILRLALWKLEDSWPVTDVKFTAEVAHV